MRWDCWNHMIQSQSCNLSSLVICHSLWRKKMDVTYLVLNQKSLLSPSEQPYFISQTQPLSHYPPQNLHSDSFNLSNKVSPSILLVIIILTIIFFVSGLLHLLVRCLWRPQIREPDDFDNVTALQGQLQQLFHLHDYGVEQSFIDTLPVFHYKAIIGTKSPFDCAVCLCEFEPEDELRLLPKCSHAFHMECIDTWLLSHSTCPLCRASLLPDLSPNNSCSPIVLVLESGSENSREIVTDRETAVGRTRSVVTTSSRLGFDGENEFARKSGEIGGKDDADPAAVVVDSGERILPVKLGKFRNADGCETSNDSNVDARRCFSMGSFEYVMDENSCLQVPIRTPLKKQPSKKPSLPLTPGHRPAMSEYDGSSRRMFIGFEAMRNFQTNLKGSPTQDDGKAIGRNGKESFSISKIWLRGKKKQNLAEDPSRRAFSFRFPIHHENVVVAAGNVDALTGKNGAGGAKSSISEIAISEFGSSRWENGGSEQWCDEENQSCNSLDSQAKTPSFARRTLLWLVGRQNKVVHSSFTPNV